MYGPTKTKNEKGKLNSQRAENSQKVVTNQLIVSKGIIKKF